MFVNWNGKSERERCNKTLCIPHTAHFLCCYEKNVTISHKKAPRRIVEFYFRTFFSSATTTKIFHFRLFNCECKRFVITSNILFMLSPPLIHHMTNLVRFAVCRCEVISLKRSIQCSGGGRKEKNVQTLWIATIFYQMNRLWGNKKEFIGNFTGGEKVINFFPFFASNDFSIANFIVWFRRPFRKNPQFDS